MNTVTITLNSKPLPIIWKDRLIKIKGVGKRIWGIVESEYDDMDFWDDEAERSLCKKLVIKPIYRPSPKSTLNNKKVFSKFNRRIIPLTKNDNQ